MVTLKRQHWISFYFATVGLIILTVLSLFSVSQTLAVSFLDVGQGDAILIQTPQHQNVLIDTGPGTSIVERLGEEMGFFEKEIDLFVLTHPDWDHYGGILDVLQKYKIKRVAITGISASSPIYTEFLTTAREQGAEILFVNSDQDLQIAPNLVLDVIYPFSEQSLVGQMVKNKNDTSISMRLLQQWENGWQPLMMLSGDAEAAQELELVMSGQDLRADILKLGHHGSKTSTTTPFLAAVDPTVGVISCGKENQFGHPHTEVMERVGDLEIRRTDEEGTVRFEF